MTTKEKRDYLNKFLSIFGLKLKDMNPSELHEVLIQEMNYLITLLLKKYKNPQGQFPNFIINELGQKFAIEINVLKTKGTIRTFHLREDDTNYSNLIKHEILRAGITAEINNEGQVTYRYTQSGITDTPSKFIELRSEKYHKAVSDFLDELEP